MKEYEAVVRLGQRTNTLDVTGRVIESVSSIDISIIDINSVVNNYIGHIEQEPPDFSAVRINGKRLYELCKKRN